MFMRRRQTLSLSRKHQSQILQNSVDVSLLRAPEFDVLADEAKAGAASGHGPGEVGAAVDGALAPFGAVIRHVDVQTECDGLRLLMRALPDRQRGGVRGRSPR